MLGENNHSYEDEVLEDLTENIVLDPFRPLNVQSEQFPDDISDAIEHLIFIKGFDKIDIHIERDPKSEYLRFWVTDRA